MIAPTTVSSSGIDPLAATSSPVEPAVLDQGPANPSEIMPSAANDDEYDTDDDADFWNVVIQEEELFKTADKPTNKEDSSTAPEDPSRKSPGRAASKALKRKPADPRSKKECQTIDKTKKKKDKGSKRRRISKKALYDYRASLKLGMDICSRILFKTSKLSHLENLVTNSFHLYWSPV